MDYIIKIKHANGDITEYQYSSYGDARRVAKDGARTSEGVAIIRQGGRIVAEYKYDDGTVLVKDSDGNWNYA